MEEENKEEKQTEEKNLQENLNNPLFVNYNLLKNLEEIKKINYSILEILNFFYQKENTKEPEEERQGVFKPN